MAKDQTTGLAAADQGGGREVSLAGLSGPLARVAAGLRVPVVVRVGEVELPLAEVAGLTPGAVVALDRAVGEAVEVMAAGSLVAKGELVSLEGRLGVRITEVVAASERVATSEEG